MCVFNKMYFSVEHALTQTKLYAQLFTNYNSDIRPENHTTVTAGFSLAAIVDLVSLFFLTSILKSARSERF